jgi:sulfite exporter TauE/SafE
MGTACLLTCGPIYAAYLIQQGGKGYRLALRSMLGIFIGRFIGYSIFGSLAGLIGAKVAICNRPIMMAIAYLLSAAFLVVACISTRHDEGRCSLPRLMRLTRQPVLLGLVTGINYCPPFLVAFTKAIISGGVFRGTMFFVSFFFGTSTLMMPLFMFGGLPGRSAFRTIGVIASLIVAAWLFASAIFIIVRLLGPWSN